MLFNYAIKKAYTIDIDEFAKSFDNEKIKHSQDKNVCEYIETSKKTLIKKYNDMNMQSFNSKYISISKPIYQYTCNWDNFDMHLHFDVPPISNLNKPVDKIPLSFFEDGDIIYYNETDLYNKEWAENTSPLVLGFLPLHNHVMFVADGNHRITSKIKLGSEPYVNVICLTPDDTARMLFDDFEKIYYEYINTIFRISNPIVYDVFSNF